MTVPGVVVAMPHFPSHVAPLAQHEFFLCRSEYLHWVHTAGVRVRMGGRGVWVGVGGLGFRVRISAVGGVEVW